MAFTNLDNGDEIVINERENFHAARTMKTLVWEIYVFILLSKNVTNKEETIGAMPDVSKIIYDSMRGSSK